MRLLAQINFDREKVEAPLPQGGMLQFFLAYDDVYGLHYHDEIRQKNWRIVYHEKIDTNMNAELVEGLGIPTDTENQEYYSPVLKSCVFHLVKKETWITSMHSDAFDTLTLELAEELFGETEAEFGSDVFGDEQFTLIVEEDSHNKNSQLLGHPYFTQEDVREEGSRYDTLLFQLDSETVDKEKITMWGDCGVGNFFINAEDLQRLDFSNVLYNWDCC